MSNNRYSPFTNIAFAIVTAGLAPITQRSNGIDTVTRISAGVYDLTLTGGGIDQIDCIDIASIRSVGVVNPTIAVSHTSDTVKRVSTSVGGLFADADFTVRLDRAPLYS